MKHTVSLASVCRALASAAVVAGIATLGFGAPVSADDMSTGTSATGKTFPFAAQNTSGETGSVTLTPASDNTTTVLIKLEGAPADAQPAHIHVGPCAKLDPKPAFPLNNVVDGTSTTVVKQPISKLLGGTYAVNVHKSPNDIATYVACADLGTASAPSSDSSSGGK